MSLLGPSALGIDVSDGTLKAVLLRRRGRRVTLLRTWRRPCADDSDEAAARAAAELLLRLRPAAGTRVVLSLPARGIFSRTYMIPVLEAARTADLVEYEVLSELGQPGADLLIRHHVRKGVGQQPVAAYALRRRDVQAFVGALDGARAAWDAFETPGFALASFVEFEQPKAADRILLGVGRLATDLVLLTDTGLWTRHLPLGLAHADAPQLARRLHAELLDAVSFLMPPDRPFRPVAIVLTEEGALDPRLPAALRAATGVNVERVAELQRVGASWRLQHDEQSHEQALSAGKAFGLALGGVGLGRYRCPVHEGNPARESLRSLPLVTTGVAAACAVLLGLGPLSRAWTAEFNETLPIRLEGEIADRHAARVRLERERDRLAVQAESLLELGRTRGATFALRRALGVLGKVVEERQERALHLDQAWLATDAPAVLKLTLHADPAFDDSLADRLVRAFRPDFGDVAVTGPEPAPVGGLSRFTVEIRLP